MRRVGLLFIDAIMIGSFSSLIFEKKKYDVPSADSCKLQVHM